jgi:hypothetical protein
VRKPQVLISADAGERLLLRASYANAVEQLRKGWIEGQTVAAMAREFDIPSATVSGALKRFGVLVKRGPKPNPVAPGRGRPATSRDAAVTGS